MICTKIYILLGYALLLCLVTCQEPTKPIQLPVDLSVENVSVTDVRLRLTIEGGDSPHSYRLSRDGEQQLEGSYAGTDTILADHNLVPNTLLHLPRLQPARG